MLDDMNRITVRLHKARRRLEHVYNKMKASNPVYPYLDSNVEWHRVGLLEDLEEFLESVLISRQGFAPAPY